MPELQAGVGDEEVEGRVTDLVVDRDSAVFDIERVYFDINSAPIGLFLDVLASSSNALCLGILSLKAVGIDRINRIEGHVVNVDIGYFRRIFDQPVTGEGASRDDNVDMVAGSRHGIHGYIGKSVLGLDTGERLHQEVRSSLQRHFAAVEDQHAGAKPGWIGMVRLLDVTDVVRDDVQMGQVERFRFAGFHVNDITLIDYETVDLERIGILQRVLPSLLTQRSRVFLLRCELGVVDMKLRVPQKDICHHAAKEQSPPMDPERHDRGKVATGGCGCASCTTVKSRSVS